MNGKIYLVEYTIIVFIMMLFSPNQSIKNILIPLIIVLIQITLERYKAKRFKQ